MPDLNLDDITLHYEDEGTATDAPPLVLISGMLSDSASWGPFGQSLTKSHRVIRPDNRTTGRTTPVLAATSPEQNAADLLSLLDHLQIAKAHLIGHSMGGYIAAELSALAPDRTASLTLLSSAPLNLARSWHLFQTLTDIRRTAPDGLWLRALFPWLFHHDFFEDPAKIEGAVAASLAYPFAQSLEAMQHQLDALTKYRPQDLTSRINVPTLALLARNDLIVPHDQARNLLMTLPKCQVQTIENAAHSIHWDAPAQVLDHILPFLQEHSHAN